MNTADLLYQQGLAFHRQGLLAQAQQSYEQAVQANPRHAPALHTLGVMKSQAGDPETGLRWIGKALAVDPHNPVFLTNASSALITLKRFEQALALCVQALVHKPDHVPALHNQGLALVGLLRLTEAVEAFDKALQIKTDLGDVLIQRNATLCELKAYSLAISKTDALLALNPDFFEAHLSKGQIYAAAKRYPLACQAYEAALALRPDHAMGWFLRGRALEYDKRYVDAIQSYSQAMALDPNLPYVTGSLLHAKMLCCNWEGLDTLYHQVKELVDQHKAGSLPFGYQAICDDEASLKACAITMSKDKYPARPAPYIHPAWPPHLKIRVGYLCGEFREQATSILMTEVWEQHDKSKFEIYAFDNGWNDHSPRRARIEKAFDHFFDISQMPDRDVADLIHAHQIDILVNLNAFFGLERNNVFALRPSPVQVNYLGFPGTMGAPYMDYLIADEHVIPVSSQSHYTEKIVYLPGCYQPNDTQRPISNRIFTREELGLPAQGFVYCCFNNNYKITPGTFDVWMRILKQVPGSVLWLLQDTPEAAIHLRQEAEKRGIDAKRLVFADRMPNAEHLARHAIADLFLDTWPYNAHTTASDALWAGLPILTLRSPTFAGRVCSSLLTSVQLTDFITSKIEDYETIAVECGLNPSKVLTQKHRINTNKKNYRLYNSKQHTLELENIYLLLTK